MKILCWLFGCTWLVIQSTFHRTEDGWHEDTDYVCKWCDKTMSVRLGEFLDGQEAR